MKALDNLKWRYATKKFDISKKVDKKDLDQILEAVRYSASSYGLQPYKILVIEDVELRKQLKQVSFMQPQITDANYVIAFCNYTQFGDKEVDEFIDLMAEIRKIDKLELDDYALMMKAKINKMSNEDLRIWTAKQAYIALGTLLVSAADIKVDVCPMEGFQAEKYKYLLGLEEENLEVAVIATIGYRSEEDKFQYEPKVRKQKEKLYKFI